MTVGLMSGSDERARWPSSSCSPDIITRESELGSMSSALSQGHLDVYVRGYARLHQLALVRLRMISNQASYLPSYLPLSLIFCQILCLVLVVTSGCSGMHRSEVESSIMGGRSPERATREALSRGWGARERVGGSRGAARHFGSISTSNSTPLTLPDDPQIYRSLYAKLYEGLYRSARGPLELIGIPFSRRFTYPYLDVVTREVHCSKPVKRARLNSTRLKRALSEFKFRRPRKFRALVVEVTLRDGCVVRERSFDWGRKSRQAYGWLVGSAIKPFAALGALERLDQLGVSLDAQLTFYHRDIERDEPARCITRSESCTPRELIRLALKRSDNGAYNRLIELTGYDYLNAEILGRHRGIRLTGLHRPYAKRTWRRKLGGHKTFRERPKIIIKDQGERYELSARSYRVGRRGQYHCPGGGTCATLADLAKMMGRVFLHERLPPSERDLITLDKLQVVREALIPRRVRSTSTAFVRSLKRELPRGAKLYHKSGYARWWASDIVYIEPPQDEVHRHRRWIVAVAGRSGRKSLISVGRALGTLLSDPDHFKD